MLEEIYGGMIGYRCMKKFAANNPGGYIGV
jgi:hypothetical protein